MEKNTLPAAQSENTDKKLPWHSPTIKKITYLETQAEMGTGTDGGIHTSGIG